MTPFKQIVQHNPDAGVYGDCWRTCIACLLDMHPSLVPHFVQLAIEEVGPGEPSGDRERELALEWLESLGYRMVTVNFDANAKHLGTTFFTDDVLYILGGASPNYDCAHAVIGRGNFECVWDPSPSGKGLKGGWYDKDSDAHYYTVELIVPRPRYHANSLTGYKVEPPSASELFLVEWIDPETGAHRKENKWFTATNHVPAKFWAEDWAYGQANKGWHKVTAVM